jgi:hypothetical protein
MAEVYLTERLVASIRTGKSLEETINGMGAVANAEALRLLQGFLQTPGADGLLDLEERLSRLLAQVSAAFAALAVATVCRTGALVRRAVAAVQQAADETPPWYDKGLRETEVRFLGGLAFRFKTPYLIPLCPRRRGRKRGVGRRGPSGRGCYPALEAIGVRAGASPALQSAVARQAVRVASFEETRQSFLEQGCRMNVKTVRRIALAVGNEALAQRQARIEASKADVRFSNEFAGKRVVIGVDGGRVRLREGGERGRVRKSGRRGFRAEWREPKLMTAHVIDEKGRQDGEVPPFYEATMGDADEAFELFVAELRLRGVAQAKQVIVVADGACWIWNRSRELPALLDVPEDKVTRVVDFYHAVEHLQTIAESRMDWSLDQVQAWVKRRRRLLRKGWVDQVVADARQLRRARNRATIRKEIAYFKRLAPFMRYNEYRTRGIPLGSGATESAIRRVVNLRLKGAGIFWKRRNAERMLHLRAYLKAGRWQELIRRVMHASPDGESRSILRPLELEAAA